MQYRFTLLFLFFFGVKFLSAQPFSGSRQKYVQVADGALLNEWPAQVTPLCPAAYKIVIVGSSTAFGTGASPIDSSWARKFKGYVLLQNAAVQVENLATLGLTSWDVSPTGTVPPPPFTVDPMRNITKALSLNPNAIILNLPSNDVARGISTANIHQNFTNIVAAATAQNVPVWVTTTQPRNGLSPAEGVLQAELRDWINLTYGNKAVDFWTNIANPDNTINTFYSAGDGVHLNNEGHHVLFTRMVAEKIWDTICRRNDIPPVARAGNDTSITAASPPITLNGSLSTDADGTIVSYNWAKIVGPATGGIVGNAAGAVASASSFVSGLYKYQLTVTDNIGIASKDTVNVNVSTGALALNDAEPGPNAPLNSKYLKVFPNPVTDLLHIKIPKAFSDQYSIVLSDAVGNIIFRKNVVKRQENITELISAKTLRAGIYILQFLHKENKLVYKIVKL